MQGAINPPRGPWEPVFFHSVAERAQTRRPRAWKFVSVQMRMMKKSRAAHAMMTPLLAVALVLSAAAAGTTLQYRTSEEEPLSSVIGTLARDASITGGSTTTFRMMKQLNASFIRLRESDGQLTVGERVDREKLCRRVARCRVGFDVVSVANERFQLIHVEVEVQDINDHAPEFTRKEVHLEIPESSALGTRIPLDAAVDEDVGSNYIQRYDLLSADGYFSLEVLTRANGEKHAELVLKKELDRETRASHSLELVATDGGRPPRSGSTRIHVTIKDSNDNHPACGRERFSVEVAEDTPVGFLILDLNATDADEGLNGEVVYALENKVPLEIRQLFRLDRGSGRLTLENPLDFESRTTYEFNVQASDLGANPRLSLCKVVVRVRDVNDNAPEVTVTPMTSVTTGVAHITEAAAQESFVALVSTSDRDSGSNGQVHCALHGHEHFKLQQAYDDSFMIVSTAPLDREKIAEYNLTVVAEDLGSPPFRTVRQFTIRVSDENDNAPVFSKALYEVSLLENNAPGALITTLVALDGDLGQNSAVSYELVDTYVMGFPVSRFVSLDPATGSLYALRSFNYEVLKHLELRVRASDGGSPRLRGSAAVSLTILDQNDNPPQFTHPVQSNASVELLLARGAPTGSVVAQIHATDADEGRNGELTFALLDGATSMFSINSATGEIFLNQDLGGVELDTLSLTISVSDQGTPPLSSSATVLFSISTSVLPSELHLFRTRLEKDRSIRDYSVVIIAVLAGSCALLLLAIILIATSRGKRRADGGGESSGTDEGFLRVEPYPDHTSLCPDFIHCCSDDAACTCEPERGSSGGLSEGYSTLRAYEGDAERSGGDWKGSRVVVSGKDSGKGDSDCSDCDSEAGRAGHTWWPWVGQTARPD